MFLTLYFTYTEATLIVVYDFFRNVVSAIYKSLNQDQIAIALYFWPAIISTSTVYNFEWFPSSKQSWSESDKVCQQHGEQIWTPNADDENVLLSTAIQQIVESGNISMTYFVYMKVSPVSDNGNVL